MTTNRFDQLDFDEHPYGECKDCGISIRDDAASHEHMEEKRHAIWILNPDRQHRIDREVSWEVESAFYDLFDRLHELVDSGDATAEEIEKALWSAPGIDGEWRDFVRDSQ